MSGRIKQDDKKTVKTAEIRKSKRDTSRSRLGKSYTEEKTKSPVKSKSPSRKKSPARTKSPTRNQSPSRKKSPSRNKSPVKPKKVQVQSPPKSPLKSPRKSPARKSPSRQSPGRKSPSRTSPARVRLEADIKYSTNIHTSTPVLDFADTESDSEFKPFKPTVRSRISRSKFEGTPVKGFEPQEVSTGEYYSLTKRSSVSSSKVRETERVVHLKADVFTPQEQKLTEFSDDDEITQAQTKRIDSIESRPYKPVFVTEFGGLFGAVFFITFIPIFAVGFHIFCNKEQCTYKLPDLHRYKMISTYIDVPAFLSFTAYSLLLALLAALPFGGRKVYGNNLNKYGRSSYVTNGWISLLITHLLLIGLQVYGIPVVNYIYDKYFEIAVAALVHGILFSIYLYIRSFFVPISALNPNGDTNSYIYNFFMGREVNPSILDIINVKIYLYRVCLISTSLIVTVIIFKSLNLTSFNLLRNEFNFATLNLDVTCLTLALMWYIYLYDMIFLEKMIATTFEMQYEGIGYMSSVCFFTIPSLYGTIIKYVYDYDIKLDIWLLALAFLQFFMGYIIYRGSNSQKDTFRKNPYSPSVAHLEAIPTAQGKKLIVSGFWGVVRHPNYLGDILIHLSFLYFVVNVPPALIAIMIVPLLVHRAKRDAFRCKQKYDAAWDRYCQRVKYVLIPKVY